MGICCKNTRAPVGQPVDLLPLLSEKTRVHIHAASHAAKNARRAAAKTAEAIRAQASDGARLAALSELYHTCVRAANQLECAAENRAAVSSRFQDVLAAAKTLERHA